MNNIKLNQNIVLITGGSAGIGLATVKKFIKSGSKVYITYLKKLKRKKFKNKKFYSYTM